MERANRAANYVYRARTVHRPAALDQVREIVAAALPGQELYGFTPLAGLPLGFRGTATGERVSGR